MNRIIFELAGCDISFIAEAPEDITLKQLLKQCNKIKHNMCSCDINNWDKEDNTKEDVEIWIYYDSIRKTNDDVSCSIIGSDKEWIKLNI